MKLDAETIGPLALNESFLHDPCPGRRPAEAGHLGECLREWNRGVIWEHIQIEGEDHEIGCQINTDKHMLIFEISPRSVYCRAARFAAVNEGVVFDQNIRQGQASFMIPDNREAAQPLIIEKQRPASGMVKPFTGPLRLMTRIISSCMVVRGRYIPGLVRQRAEAWKVKKKPDPIRKWTKIAEIQSRLLSEAQLI